MTIVLYEQHGTRWKEHNANFKNSTFYQLCCVINIAKTLIKQRINIIRESITRSYDLVLKRAIFADDLNELNILICEYGPIRWTTESGAKPRREALRHLTIRFALLASLCPPIFSEIDSQVVQSFEMAFLFIGKLAFFLLELKKETRTGIF